MFKHTNYHLDLSPFPKVGSRGISINNYLSVIYLINNIYYDKDCQCSLFLGCARI